MIDYGYGQKEEEDQMATPSEVTAFHATGLLESL